MPDSPGQIPQISVSPTKPPVSNNYPKADPDFVDPPSFIPGYYCCAPNELGLVCPNQNPADNGGCTEAFITCQGGRCTLNNTTIVCNAFSFPTFNGDQVPMLKTALNGTAMAPYAKIAFEKYNDDGVINLDATAQTIITMGNESQCGASLCNEEICKAAIKSFQYGFGVKQQGASCKVTIVDEKGSEFALWVQRLVKNLEGASTPVAGNLRMKAQFGWYITGGDPTDMCGQDAALPSPYNVNTPAPPGQNNAYLVLSPVMYFIPTWINVNFDRNKFIYQIEGVDVTSLAQTTPQGKNQGSDKAPMYLTTAIENLGKQAQPPFRVQFRALDPSGNLIDMQFVKRDGKPSDRACKCEENFPGEGYGPWDTWKTGNKPPLEAINDWLTSYAVGAFDTTGYTQNPTGRVGVTMNYDPTFKAGTILNTNDSRCTSGTGDVNGIGTCFIPGHTQDNLVDNLPQYGSLIVWADSLIWCNNNMPDPFWDSRMKAVYLVNGGNCGSPVLSFHPSLRWNWMAGIATGGAINAVDGQALRQAGGLVKANCRIAASNGPIKVNVPNANAVALKIANEKESVAEATLLHVMANLPRDAIEAELVVQGDPSPWLCSPLFAYGRTVGIIFINPFFLDGQDTTTGCPTWAADDPSDNKTSICNNILTNKGWMVMGVDHQISDGKYITTIKLFLGAPGARVQDANFKAPPPPMGMAAMALSSSPSNSNANNLGAWDNGDNTVPYGGQFSPVSSYAVGSTSAGWVMDLDDEGFPIWVGGGEAGDDGYDIPDEIPDDINNVLV